jgi:hypothetical protein
MKELKLTLSLAVSLILSACSEPAPVSSFSWDAVSNVAIDSLGFDTMSECLSQLESVNNESICHVRTDNEKLTKGYSLSIRSNAKGRTVGMSNYESLEKCKVVENLFNQNSETHSGECVEFQINKTD